MYNYVASFLENRTLEIKSGNPSPTQFGNNTGVPQGSIISPLLFNVVMRKLALAIHEGSGVRMTMYAEDITLWTEKQDYVTTESACTELQAALLILEDLLTTTGMQISPTKSAVLKIGGSPSERDKVHLFIGAHELCEPQEGWIRLLGVPINNKGNATTWIQQLRKNWDATIHLLKRIGNKFGGASTQFMRLAGRAVLTSRLTYGSTCFNLTRTQLKQLTILHHKLLRSITGLPRHTPTDHLYTYAELPAIQSLIEYANCAHEDRRTLTIQGRHLIKYDEIRQICTEPIRTQPTTPPPSPWLRTQPITHKPRSRKEQRRYIHQRSTLARLHHRTEPGTYAIYTDASITQTSIIGSVYHESDPSLSEAITISTAAELDSTTAELQAILLALTLLCRDIGRIQGKHRPKQIKLYTDNASAIQDLRQPNPASLLTRTIHTTVQQLIDRHGIPIFIEWTPGHQDNPGNEAAHDMASAANPSLQSTCTLSNPLPPPDVNEDVIARRIRRKNRQRTLKENTPRPDQPIPLDIPRGLQVLLCKARTGYAITPDIRDRWEWLRRYGKKRPDGTTPTPPPFRPCTLCHNSRPDVKHLIWDCSKLDEERRRHKPHYVLTYEDWIKPQQNQKATYTSLWSFARDANLPQMT